MSVGGTKIRHTPLFKAFLCALVFFSLFQLILSGIITYNTKIASAESNISVVDYNNSRFLTWSKISGADEYKVYVDGKSPTTTSQNFMIIDGALTKPGLIRFKVEAVYNVNTVLFTFTLDYTNFITLSVKNLRVVNSTVFWSCDYAEYFSLTLNSVPISPKPAKNGADYSANLSEYLLLCGAGYTLKINATAPSNSYILPSETATMKFSAQAAPFSAPANLTVALYNGVYIANWSAQAQRNRRFYYCIQTASSDFSAAQFRVTEDNSTDITEFLTNNAEYYLAVYCADEQNKLSSTISILKFSYIDGDIAITEEFDENSAN